MPTTAADAVRTNTTTFPVFASKEAFMTALREMADTSALRNIDHELLYRISNTNTSTWADPTARHDD